MRAYYQDEHTTIYNFDAVGALYNLSPQSISCVVTSIPLDWVDNKGSRYHLDDITQYAEGIRLVLEALKVSLKTDAQIFMFNLGGAVNQTFGGLQIATMPEVLAEVFIKAGSKEGDVILDPFAGSGTTGLVAKRLKRKSILIDNNYRCCQISKERIG